MAVYLDSNATTRLDHDVLTRMLPWLSERCGHPDSADHEWGWAARDVVEESRAQVAEAVQSGSSKVVFFGGATEALHAVFSGFAGFATGSFRCLVTCATEHQAVLGPVQQLANRWEIPLKVLPVNGTSAMCIDQLGRMLERDGPALVAIMAANNEIGTVHPIRAIASVVHQYEGLFVSDTTQAFGKLPFHCDADDVDACTVSGHKIHGPQGVGALILRSSCAEFFPDFSDRGAHESGPQLEYRGVANIVGLGEACRLVQLALTSDIAMMGKLPDRLKVVGILSEVEDSWSNGNPESRLCNTASLGFGAIDGRELVRHMHNIGASTRAACSSSRKLPVMC